jgi:hypothetical protein
MIRHKTVFVVGAGASCAYDFPSGRDLLWDAREASLQNLQEQTRRYYGDRIVELFRTALTQCQSDSLDALLELREDIDHVGRLYIAGRILRAENSARHPARKHNDWLTYLFQAMDDGSHSLDQFGQNPVTFVTYNYDRLIEHRISEGLRARYRASDEAVAQFWAKCPVIHLHGSVGPLTGSRRVPYGASEDGQAVDDAIANAIERASHGIKIVHQADGDSSEFQAARAALASADRVFFLGFSFGHANVDRLGFENVNPSSAVICTRFRMTDSETRVRIYEPFKRFRITSIRVCDAHLDCLGGLSNYIDELVSRY